MIALGESLAIGFRALAISANYAAQDPEAKDGEVQTEITRGQILFSFAIAIGFALMLFKVTPALITNWLPIDATGSFVVIEGVIRVAIFLLYLLLISLLPDLRRVFQYHAAEHKAINAYEAGAELTPEKVQKFSLIHPRCGTAFLLWVMVIGIFVFAFVGQPAWYWLIAEPDPAPAGDRRDRLRADPLRGQAPGQPGADDAARARALAAAADDAAADARPDRGLDPRAPGGAPPRGRHHRRTSARSRSWPSCAADRPRGRRSPGRDRSRAGTGTLDATSSGTFALPDRPALTTPTSPGGRRARRSCSPRRTRRASSRRSRARSPARAARSSSSTSAARSRWTRSRARDTGSSPRRSTCARGRPGSTPAARARRRAGRRRLPVLRAHPGERSVARRRTDVDSRRTRWPPSAGQTVTWQGSPDEGGGDDRRGRERRVRPARRQLGRTHRGAPGGKTSPRS